MLEGLVEWESRAEGPSFNVTIFCVFVWVDIHVCVSAHGDHGELERGSASLFMDAWWSQKRFSLSKKMMSTNMSENP